MLLLHGTALACIKCCWFYRSSQRKQLMSFHCSSPANNRNLPEPGNALFSDLLWKVMSAHTASFLDDAGLDF